MRFKDYFALNVGLDLVGGVLAGILVGYGIDYLFKSSPYGLIFFFFLGIVAGFYNAYKDLKKLKD